MRIMRTMENRILGTTGVSVSKLCLGTMMFGEWGGTTYAECERMIHTALDAGINFIDTADVYSAGESEEIIGRALAGGRRDDVVLATKFSAPMGEDPNRRGNSRRWITRAVEDSLRRLKTDRIDLYQAHRPDPTTAVDETLGALTDLVRAGKVRYVGSSTFPVSEIVEAQWTAERRHQERFVCEQPPYSMLARGIEADILPTCLRHGMGVMVWSPLGGGWLSGNKGSAAELEGSRRRQIAIMPDRFDMSDPANQRKLEAANRLGEIADEAGLTLIQMAIAFVVNHPAVTTAILGPRTIAHLEDQLAAADVRLDAEILDAIDAVVAPGLNVNPNDSGYLGPALQPPALRR
jgi:aryl-alcohol dehydrogenase-like predicted oxidoreductase